MQRWSQTFAVSVLALSIAGTAIFNTTVQAAENKSEGKSGARDERRIAAATADLKALPGLFEIWPDADQGRILMSVSMLDTPFLLISSLPYGLGSNDVGLDRGQGGESKIVRFEKRGKRLFLIQDNTRYVARSDNAEERASVREAFAASVLWSTDIIASESGKHLIDVSSFLLADRHGIAARLDDSKQGSYKVDDKRSAVLPALAKSFPDNTELEAELTFAGPGKGEFVRQVAADAESLTLRQHISFVRLPDAAYKPRAYHPGSGGFDTGYVDFATPLADSLDVRWQVRFRLEKTDPGAAVSPVKKPIIFYLDRGTPEPVRSALLEGARWWATAFEKAGFKDAYRVEMLPEGVDPMDVRYNTIQWVHRATRGWSYGNAINDPRTGEIIKGAVTLGSQRVRQDILIAEALLAPYGKGDSESRKRAAEQMALARLRQLSAHEVGHTLGIAHNFATSRHGNGSVMDYPHPILRLNARGEVELNDAYGVGVGPWDEFVVKHLYSEFPGKNEQQELALLRAGAKKAGLQYVGDNDARAPGAVHSNGLLWDFGADSLATWDQLLKVRRVALDKFSPAVLPPARQIGELEARLVPLYLLHRYQTEAVARLIGGGEYRYSLAGEVQSGTEAAGVTPVAAGIQHDALKKLADSLRAEHLALPASLLDVLTPPAQGYERHREYFSTRMNVVFDALSAAEAAAAQTSQFLFDAARINRLYWQHARDSKLPGVGDALREAFAVTWQRGSVPADLPAGEAVQLAANWVVLDAALNLLDSGRLHPQVDAEVRVALAEQAGWMKFNPGQGSVRDSRLIAAKLITDYLNDPRSVKLRPLPPIPPGAPI